jgi:hypothetical protein
MPLISTFCPKIIPGISGKYGIPRATIKAVTCHSIRTFGSSQSYDMIDPSSLPLHHQRLRVPDFISKPSYISNPTAFSNLEEYSNEIILLKNAQDLEKMRKAGSLAKDVLVYAKSLIKEGLTTKKLDTLGNFMALANTQTGQVIKYRWENSA